MLVSFVPLEIQVISLKGMSSGYRNRNRIISTEVALKVVLPLSVSGKAAPSGNGFFMKY